MDGCMDRLMARIKKGKPCGLVKESTDISGERSLFYENRKIVASRGP